MHVGTCFVILLWRTAFYPVSNLLQFRITWSYHHVHVLHNSGKIKRQVCFMAFMTISFTLQGVSFENPHAC